MSEIKKIHMGPAKCAVDLGDGSERGEYVNQDYILNKLASRIFGGRASLPSFWATQGRPFYVCA